MLHGFKTSAALAAGLLIASACSSSNVSQQQANPIVASSGPVAESAPMLKASPVDLEKLAALAGLADTPQLASRPANTRIERKIEPAKAVTIDGETLFEAEPEMEGTPLPVIQPDSRLLDGTVYRSTSFSAPPRPTIVPGVFRTIEYRE